MHALWRASHLTWMVVHVLQVACILLPLCFLYDIFWVFLEPRIMGGPSVMVEVLHSSFTLCTP